MACLLEGFAIKLGATLLDVHVWLGLGGEGWNARDECVSESEVGTSAWAVGRKVERVDQRQPVSAWVGSAHWGHWSWVAEWCQWTWSTMMCL